MKRRNLVYVALALTMVLSLVLTGCAKPEPKLGSAEHPIQLYFVPSVDTSVIVASGEKIANFLKEQTGYEFKVSVPTSYAATIEAMGVAEGDAMGFIPAQGYVLASQKYGVQVGLATVRYGNSWYATEYIARADSGINSLEDLEGKKWAIPSVTSTSGYLYPMAQLKREGITPGEQVEAGGHPQVVLAVYNGQVDFGTVFFSPPGDAGDWKWGDSPEPTGDYHLEDVNGTQQAFIGDAQLRDARCNVLEQYPDVIEQVKIIGLSDQIPNDTVSFVKDFPEDLKTKIEESLIAYAESDEGQEVLANKDFYDITGFEKVQDTFYDPVRNLITQLGITEDDILK